ncbi:MAG: diaminopimelate decarboxylase [Marinifilaceae bacterium]
MKPLNYLNQLKTPFYYYNMELLDQTVQHVSKLSAQNHYAIHYAIKANANPVILRHIAAAGLGADCVSGNEIKRALECGFPADKIVYAGVGKSDDEIILALENDIFCFNCESIPEIEVINELAGERGKVADIALRLNPEVDAHTHHYITTGTEENKFGIPYTSLASVVEELKRFPHIRLIGLHFHIGSQITEMEVFQRLCARVREIIDEMEAMGLHLPHINFGGGLGINYMTPHDEPMADFDGYFATFAKYFPTPAGTTIHFELGRSIVAHCGDLVSRVLYVKEGKAKKFVILDAGMSDLLRPALYQAYHHIENISSDEPEEVYDVVGPICESSDCFGKEVKLNRTHRGDLVVLHSAGAYGEIMASQYNLRDLPKAYFSTDEQ